jgi:hypothetical protein
MYTETTAATIKTEKKGKNNKQRKGKMGIQKKIKTEQNAQEKNRTKHG